MISIFAKRAFLNTNPHNEFISKEKSYRGHGHLQRVSTMIREQVIPYLDARLNPTEGYQDDVCIYVKPHLKKGMDFTFEGKRSYIDIIDGANLGEVLKKHPEVGLIVCSEADLTVMSKELPNNKVVLIPQHHCNFERRKRERQEVTKIGVIGTKEAFPPLPQELKGELAKRNMRLIEFSGFFSREDIIDFYMNIDIQIIWRPYKKILSNPLKIVNASSFGVPTVALKEEAFNEVPDCYLPVHNLEGLLFQIDMLRTEKKLYKQMHDDCLKASEKYHIENIAKLYTKL